MKRAKNLLTVLTATSLLFGASVTSYAAETKSVDQATPVLISADVTDKLIYTVKSYIDSNDRIIGLYPVITDMSNLSDKILSDIDKSVEEFNLKPSDDYYEDVVKFSVDESLEGYAKIYVSIEKDFLSSSYVYYVDKKLGQEITKLEFEKAVEDAQESSASGSAIEVAMIPLRVNAEKLGWKVDWEQKNSLEPSKAILSKDSKVIRILVDANLTYDLIINENQSETFVRTAKLDKAAELQDSTLYVPSTFVDSYLIDGTEVTE